MIEWVVERERIVHGKMKRQSHPSFYEKVIEYTIKLWKDMESYWNNLGENSELDLKN
ncbi:hypothetical protein GLOIN_2v1782686 [Rhizophagus irregularis DAOM 181602=DAOM 197198]|uniref:Uncharacterized protein n=1 Tax=Rhizophagus irregularis (strain DAOM 181602 / DAOM 197198 / MUCL 43194) TaxID=747089 RepID=A0A2P4PGR4_RHIID|nr:hypothetical protein GLOIN_2v1782686 [Rhizophagus irregularis DAOM 181602=DAOM 197198]POG64586.1 hypothetical protein GLOIN_2v1782686 [Rhizophagus irregularis DAOM 181602=DAOM 197198]GET60107.1 hypothetical protein GLOIN_2v1782686 [Rhizophagus irregularis DAOM 181602=DAOM 197198]CAG8460323.1 2679_t:CDS:2 [Rhizophagus irregularis]|eukprot:XP_025171452.1 hypothetical protein GLOIN_2v1782686 [Rhizophagus irregularis DAOM 181602=DAOM 197198]